MSRPLSVLIVEDQDDDAELLLRELRLNGYQPKYERVDTQGAMKRALEHEQWDIVISDWSMPEFSANEALAMLKAQDLDLPFIICSGTIGEETAVAAMRMGAHDFVVKGRFLRLGPAIERELREAQMRTERRNMQEQLMFADRMASVGILAAGLAHEINNPLSSVLANLSLAVQDLKELAAGGRRAHLSEILEELEDALAAGDRIREIVCDVKLFSRAEEDTRVPVDIHSVLESTLRMVFNETRHRAEVVRELAAVPLVNANESRLGQVFMNLLVNAAQSIPEGRAQQNRITVRTKVQRDGRVAIEVSDTGLGMPPEAIKKLFTSFFTTKPRGVGTGLGLSICHRIVASMGGEIVVESELGKGSTFRVLLLPGVSGPPAAVESKPKRVAAPRRGSLLVVDDDPAVATTLVRVLKPEHDVSTMTDAGDALEVLRSGKRFDVILCDLLMPQMTGMELYEAVHRLDADQARRMVFVTAGTFTVASRAFLDRVPNRQIDKPFEVDALRAAVNELLR